MAGPAKFEDSWLAGRDVLGVWMTGAAFLLLFYTISGQTYLASLPMTKLGVLWNYCEKFFVLPCLYGAAIHRLVTVFLNPHHH